MNRLSFRSPTFGPRALVAALLLGPLADLGRGQAGHDPVLSRQAEAEARSSRRSSSPECRKTPQPGCRFKPPIRKRPWTCHCGFPTVPPVRDTTAIAALRHHFVIP